MRYWYQWLRLCMGRDQSILCSVLICWAVILWSGSFTFLKAGDGEPVTSASTYGLSNDQLRSLEEKASNGDADSAFRISAFYTFTVQDEAAMLKWLRRAEELGHSTAAWNLAYYYRYNAHPPDYKTAFELYHKLVKRKSVDAMITMGEMFEGGLGVSKDRVEAMKWYEKAARVGKVFTMEKLSRILLEDGKVSEAYVWAEVVSLRRKRVGPEKIKQSNPADLAKRLSAEQLEQAKERAAKLDKEIPFIEPWTSW